MPRSGWALELEDYAAADRLPNADDVMALCGSDDYVQNRLDPREVMKVENQGSVGSCQGHSLSSVCEWCHCIATGHADLQLSRAWAYYRTQAIDGIRGDRGSTITGGMQLATQQGICREIMWPYQARYNPAPPRPIAELKADAERFQIRSSRRLRSYDECRVFLESGQGGIHLGIVWKSSMNAAVVSRFSGGGGGGHAVCLLACSEREDNQGRPYLWLMNSWGTRWGNGGWSEVSAACVDAWFRDRFTVVIGMSDLTTPEPRKIDWYSNHWMRD